MSDLLAHVPHTRLVPPGHYGAAGAAGVSARQMPAVGAATLAAPRGGTADLTRRCATAGLPLADAPQAVSGAGLTAIGTGRGRWLVLAEAAGADLHARLRAMAGPGAAMTDQTDANILYELSGPAARATLAKGVAIDLDPAVFGPGDAATTVIAHVGVILWRDGAGDAYRLAVARSFAPAFLRWLTASAAEFGFTLSGTDSG